MTQQLTVHFLFTEPKIFNRTVIGYDGDSFPFEIDLNLLVNQGIELNTTDFASTSENPDELIFTPATINNNVITFDVTTILPQGITQKDYTFKVRFADDIGFNLTFKIYKNNGQ